jgi:RNA polymerase sigma factor (sigma-70 family)
MTTSVDVEYLSPMTYEVLEWELPAPELDTSPDPDTQQNDLSYFMNLAGRHKLLNAAEERALATALWTARRRLLRILRQARADSDEAAPIGTAAPTRPVTPSTRRRLAAVEKLARDLSAALTAPGNAARAEGFTRARLRDLAPVLNETLQEMDETRRELVERNLRLVVWVAKSFRGRGFDFIDLIQEGNLGLMRAVDRFDPAVGARFSTFATHWIQQGIRRALAEKARMIRIPVNRIPEVRQTLYARAHLAEELDRQPRPEEIAKEIGLPTHKVEELLPAIAPIDSMDAPLGSSERKLGDLLEDRTTPTPLDDAMEAETQRAIRAVLHELPDRQRVILCMRHGIGYPRECTLEEIGDELGLSRERIRQVEKVAAASVRDWLQEHRPQLATPV